MLWCSTLVERPMIIARAMAGSGTVLVLITDWVLYIGKVVFVPSVFT